MDELKAVGCDGTVINTGSKNGVIRQLEMFTAHPLQWHICLLHTNELPLQHLIQHLDGKTNDPRGFSGAIGKMLENVKNYLFSDLNQLKWICQLLIQMKIEY